MVETAMAELVSKIKPLLEKWSPGNQTECIDDIIKAWATNSWGLDELVICETQLEEALKPADGQLSSIMEQRLSTLFGAFDEKVPTSNLKNVILGKLDRAGGSMLDSTQYTENDTPSEETMDAAKKFAAEKGCPWQPELKDFPTRKVIRWTTTRAINFKDIKRIVNFCASHPLLRERVYHVHTGAHCKDG